jgi:hypothetical protein
MRYARAHSYLRQETGRQQVPAWGVVPENLHCLQIWVANATDWSCSALVRPPRKDQLGTSQRPTAAPWSSGRFDTPRTPSITKKRGRESLFTPAPSFRASPRPASLTQARTLNCQGTHEPSRLPRQLIYARCQADIQALGSHGACNSSAALLFACSGRRSYRSVV